MANSKPTVKDLFKNAMADINVNEFVSTRVEYSAEHMREVASVYISEELNEKIAEYICRVHSKDIRVSVSGSSRVYRGDIVTVQQYVGAKRIEDDG